MNLFSFYYYSMFCSTRVIVNLFVIKSFVTRVFVCLYVLSRLIHTWSRTSLLFAASLPFNQLHS